MGELYWHTPLLVADTIHNFGTRSLTFKDYEVPGGHRCESMPITQNRGVKVGDTVKITKGQGTGQLAKVTEIHYIHVDEADYPTSPMITVDFMDGWIPSDGYEVLKGENHVV